jgi:hypothetical protein
MRQAQFDQRNRLLQPLSWFSFFNTPRSLVKLFATATAPALGISPMTFAVEA